MRSPRTSIPGCLRCIKDEQQFYKLLQHASCALTPVFERNAEILSAKFVKLQRKIDDNEALLYNQQQNLQKLQYYENQLDQQIQSICNALEIQTDFSLNDFKELFEQLNFEIRQSTSRLSETQQEISQFERTISRFSEFENFNLSEELHAKQQLEQQNKIQKQKIAQIQQDSALLDAQQSVVIDRVLQEIRAVQLEFVELEWQNPQNLTAVFDFGAISGISSFAPQFASALQLLSLSKSKVEKLLDRLRNKQFVRLPLSPRSQAKKSLRFAKDQMIRELKKSRKRLVEDEQTAQIEGKKSFPEDIELMSANCSSEMTQSIEQDKELIKAENVVLEGMSLNADVKQNYFTQEVNNNHDLMTNDQLVISDREVTKNYNKFLPNTQTFNPPEGSGQVSQLIITNNEVNQFYLNAIEQQNVNQEYHEEWNEEEAFFHVETKTKVLTSNEIRLQHKFLEEFNEEEVQEQSKIYEQVVDALSPIPESQIVTTEAIPIEMMSPCDAFPVPSPLGIEFIEAPLEEPLTYVFEEEEEIEKEVNNLQKDEFVLIDKVETRKEPE